MGVRLFREPDAVTPPVRFDKRGCGNVAMHRKITRQSRWNLHRANDRQYRTKPLNLGEGVETGWRAPLGGEGTVRLSSKGESDRITQRSAVQIRLRNHRRGVRAAGPA